MTKQKRKFQFLYFKDFTWIDPSQKDFFNGEPKSNRAYKVLDDGGPFWRVPIGEVSGLSLEKDNTVNDDRDTWKCDFEEITRKNLIELDITLKDLKMIVAELEEEIEEKDIMFEFDDPDRSIEDDMEESLSELMEFDMDMYESIIRVTTMMSEALISPAHIPLTDGLGWNMRTGKISNITMAAQSLEAYLNKEEMDGHSLLDAMYSIMTEIIRVRKTPK